jgi:hypothetical protein
MMVVAAVGDWVVGGELDERCGTTSSAWSGRTQNASGRVNVYADPQTWFAIVAMEFAALGSAVSS